MRSEICFQIRANRGKWKMAANLSKAAGMGSCINGHVVQNENSMSDAHPGQEKVAILDAGAQYGKVNWPGYSFYSCIKIVANGFIATC